MKLSVLFLAFIFSIESYGYAFLTKSDFSREKKLDFFIVSPNKKKTGVILPPEAETLDALPKYLLGSDGKLHEMSGRVSATSAKLNDGCGGESDAAELTFKADKAYGELLVIGQRAMEAVRWLPAKKMKMPAPSCISYKPKFKLLQSHLYQFSGPSSLVYFAHFESQIKKSKNCEIFDADMVGLYYSQSKTCNTINLYEKNCDWMPVDEKALSAQEFIGAIILSDKETWLIFRSQGYESKGFAAFLLMPGKGVDKSKSEVVHVTGC